MGMLQQLFSYLIFLTRYLSHEKRGMLTMWRIVRKGIQISLLRHGGKEEESMACFYLSAFICIIYRPYMQKHVWGVLPSWVAIPPAIGLTFLFSLIEQGQTQSPCPTFWTPSNVHMILRIYFHLLLSRALLLLHESCYLYICHYVLSVNLLECFQVTIWNLFYDVVSTATCCGKHHTNLNSGWNLGI
jgi:hypothetical protein